MPAVNRRRMEEASMGDQQFMEELIDVFLDDMPHQLEALRQAVQNQQGEAAAAAAHRLKGASGNLGAENLSALCTEMEQSARARQVERLPVLLEQVDWESDRVKKFLRAAKKRAVPG